MLSIERRKKILELLNKTGSVNILELAKYYEVGKETIRRDLKILAQEFEISLVYGGAYLKSHLSSTSIKEETLMHKRTANLDLKFKIAKRAVELIEPGDIIAMNSGSTVECMINYIEKKSPLYIVTTNVNIATKASIIPGIEVYIPAGKIRNSSGMVINTNTENYLKYFNINKCFFGISAISLANHITHPAVEEVENNRALLAISDKVYMLADSTKFNKKSLYQLAKIEEMNGIITDRPLEEPYQTYCRNCGVDIIVADKE